MRIVFSMDEIKNMDLLYTWTEEYSEEVGLTGTVEHYHGYDYCKAIIDALADWQEKKCIGCRDRIANEVFALISSTGVEYSVSFGISTYKTRSEQKIARLEVSITTQNAANLDPQDAGQQNVATQTAEHQDVNVVTPAVYDQKLEDLKIELKNKLLDDWQMCTWLVDEQATKLCKDVYEKAYTIENNLRAFASKVLIHFLGVNWIQRAGFEKPADSVMALKGEFVQRVPAFDNINTDFLSMTLETLVGVMFEGKVYNEEFVLGRKDYDTLQKMTANKAPHTNIADFIQKHRTVDKEIWEDLFVLFIDDPDVFKSAAHSFIGDRNHVAHSKVLSWSAYQVILRDFQTMEDQIRLADNKFAEKETSEELLATWVAESEADEAEEYDERYEREYFRDRLAGETGLDILDESAIADWFDEVLYDLYSDVYQHYHLDVCRELSDFKTPSEWSEVFSVSCPVDDGLRIIVTSVYSIDDGLGEDSTCYIVAKNSAGEELCKVELHFHNGDGYEGEEGVMEATDDTVYDASELDDFKEELISAIDDLNPYPDKADAYAYENKGEATYTVDFQCEQCGEYGVSIDEEFLPIGKCCYCGYEHELVQCNRCGEIVSEDVIENGFCPTCSAYIDKQ